MFPLFLYKDLSTILVPRLYLLSCRIVVSLTLYRYRYDILKSFNISF